MHVEKFILTAVNVETLAELEQENGGEAEVLEMMSVWIARARAGDQAAARALVERLKPIVLRIVRARRPRRMAEEDLTQEVFMKMFARLGQYQGAAPFTHWVSRIAVTTCMDHWRAQRCRPEVRWADLMDGETDAFDRLVDDRSARMPGDLLATRDLVAKLLGRLNAEDRLVIVAFELEQKTIAEICDVTGWESEFVKMRLHRARKKMARAFERLPGFDGGAWAPAGGPVPAWRRKAA